MSATSKLKIKGVRKATRTISGVTPVAVMAEPRGCPGRCVFCPTQAGAPKSYTVESPAVARARSCDFDPRRQVEMRIKMLQDMGHPADKIELIVMGGTFLAYPLDYQYDFIRGCFEGLNGASASSLAEAKEQNEIAPHRCVGMCIETRPDWCGIEEIQRMLEFGTTRVELGVQTLDEEILELVRRGHGVREVVEATKLLRDYGFKVYYHWMPGLPGSNPQKDLELFEKIFSDERFRPDGLKIYPTEVVEGSELERWYREGRYEPYPLEVLEKVLIEMKLMVPKYVRIARVTRDIPAKFIIAGCRDDLPRNVLLRRMRERGLECKCIRCREYGHRMRDGWEVGEPKLVRFDYAASGGREIFLSFEDENETLFALLRLRIQDFDPVKGRRGEIVGMIRELHVYGPEVPLGGEIPVEPAAQHKGLGRMLLAEAERIAKEEFGARRILVLSGVGVRRYYYNLGYRYCGPYMMKELSEEGIEGEERSEQIRSPQGQDKEGFGNQPLSLR